MVFWLSVIVFIAGIMMYMFFPRNDQYQQDMYQQEGNIISFVNQHQVAKDLMQQRIMWKIDDSENTGIYALPHADLIHMVPDVMQIRDIYALHPDSETFETNLNPDPNVAGASGNYTSAVVCLESCAEGTAGCVNRKRMVACPSAEQYVVTYGYMPDWWGDSSARRQQPRNKVQSQAWFKSMLKRTHGGVGCGLLAYRGVDDLTGLYALDTSQKYIGYQIVNGKRVIPPVLTKKLQTDIHLNTCETGSLCADPLQDLMFCMTSVSNPYLGEPLFWWDNLNNTGTGVDVTQRGIPLVGTLSGENVDSWSSTANYTLMGIISSQKEGDAQKDLFLLNNSTNTRLREVCSGTSCTLAVRREGDDLVSVEDIPNDRDYIFLYTVTASTQKLTVYYTQAGGTFIALSGESGSNKPTLSTPGFMDNIRLNPHLRSIRIYNGELNTRQLNHNLKVDKRRFGL